MHDGTLSIKKETFFGQECIVLYVEESEGKAKAILTKESAVNVAQALLRMAWKCGFVIMKDDEQAEGKDE